MSYGSNGYSLSHMIMDIYENRTGHTTALRANTALPLFVNVPDDSGSTPLHQSLCQTTYGRLDSTRLAELST